MEVNSDPFRLPTTRTIRCRVTLQIVERRPENKFFSQLERTLKLLDFFIRSALIPSKVNDFLFQLQDSPVQFDVMKFPDQISDLFNVFDGTHLDLPPKQLVQRSNIGPPWRELIHFFLQLSLFIEQGAHLLFQFRNTLMLGAHHSSLRYERDVTMLAK
jgi:hypothetical protein